MTGVTATRRSSVRRRLVASFTVLVVFFTLSGITQCEHRCREYDENGDPVLREDGTAVSFPCVSCLDSDAQCKSESWTLPGGVACDVSNQPNLPDGTPCDLEAVGDGACYAGACLTTVFPCSEQGLVDAVAQGGGPLTFECQGPTTIATTSTIAIDTDTILDGRGDVTIDAGGTHSAVEVVDANVELRGLSIEGGFGGQGSFGSASAIVNAGHLTLRDVEVSNNHGAASVIHSEGAPLELHGVVVRSNSGQTATIVALGGPLTITESTVVDNAFFGCVISNTAATVLDSSITHSGAGSALQSDGPLSIVRSSIVHSSSGNAGVATACDGCVVEINQSLINGSGLALQAVSSGPSDSFLEITNSTVVGGGPATMWVIEVGTELTNATIVGDGQVSFAAGAVGDALSFVVRNSIVRGDCFADTTVSASRSLFTGDGPFGSCGVSGGTNQTGIDPALINLGALQNNGGPTSTLLPGAGSLAVDAIPASECVGPDGLPLAADQRGVARPQGSACDIGAVEVLSP